MLKVYKREVKVSLLQIAKYQKGVKDKGSLLHENEVKILNLYGDLLNNSKKLRKSYNYCLTWGQRASHFEQAAKKAEYIINSVRDPMSSFTDLVEMLKMECIKAYINRCGFVISRLKTQAKKLDLTVPYFTLVQAF